jgi:hypothetical protein
MTIGIFIGFGETGEALITGVRINHCDQVLSTFVEIAEFDLDIFMLSLFKKVTDLNDLAESISFAASNNDIAVLQEIYAINEDGARGILRGDNYFYTLFYFNWSWVSKNTSLNIQVCTDSKYYKYNYREN